MASLEEQIEALESTLNAMDHEKEEPKDSSKVAMVRMTAEDITGKEEGGKKSPQGIQIKYNIWL